MTPCFLRASAAAHAAAVDDCSLPSPSVTAIASLLNDSGDPQQLLREAIATTSAPSPSHTTTKDTSKTPALGRPLKRRRKEHSDAQVSIRCAL